MAKTYYQRRDDWARRVQRHSDLTATQKNIAVTYALEFMNARSEISWAGQDKIAAATDTCTRTVRRAMKLLVELGFLQPVRSPYRSRAYRLVAEPARHPKGGHTSPTKRTGASRRTGQQRPTNHYNEPEEETAMLGKTKTRKGHGGPMSIGDLLKSLPLPADQEVWANEGSLNNRGAKKDGKSG